MKRRLPISLTDAQREQIIDSLRSASVEGMKLAESYMEVASKLTGLKASIRDRGQKILNGSHAGDVVSYERECRSADADAYSLAFYNAVFCKAAVYDCNNVFRGLVFVPEFMLNSAEHKFKDIRFEVLERHKNGKVEFPERKQSYNISTDS